MGHVYASLDQLNNEIRDAGSATFDDEAASIEAVKLDKLEAASRDIDGFCRRSRFDSGFGPRLGTNRYDGDGGCVLRLDDDLLSVTSLTTKGTLGASGTLHTIEIDFITEPYDTTPKRRIIGRGTSGGVVFPWGVRTVELVGSWGYSNVTRALFATVTVADADTDTATLSSDDDEVSPGDTILAEDEQLYIRAQSVDGLTLTVGRGANGTTAAAHNAGTAISRYHYPTDVHNACVALALRRLKARDAGADGTDGGGDMPTMRPQSERSILWSHLRDYRFELVR